MNLTTTLIILLFAFKLFSVLKRYFHSAPRQMSAKAISEVQNLINTKKVFVASKTYCPYCTAAKKLITSVYPDAYILELDNIEDGDDLQDALKKITGQGTVPNIFIGGKHIGGNSDLQALGKNKIAELIRESKI